MVPWAEEFGQTLDSLNLPTRSNFQDEDEGGFRNENEGGDWDVEVFVPMMFGE